VKERTAVALRIIRLLEGLSEEDRRMVVFDLHRTYGGPLTGAQRSARYRAGLRHEQGTEQSRKSDAPGVTERHEIATKQENDPPVAKDLEGFSSFWSKYPKRVGKGAATKAWSKRKCASVRDAIMAALECQRAFLLREGGKYTPNPATWLNERRWEDDPPALIPDGALSSRLEASLPAMRRFVERGEKA
jgi:hypothetical protein